MYVDPDDPVGMPDLGEPSQARWLPRLHGVVIDLDDREMRCTCPAIHPIPINSIDKLSP